jgi:tripartite motif-containing protein 71
VSGSASAQEPASLQFDYLYTFGSKYGIHPRKVLSSRPATAAFGNGEHPYGLGYPEGVTTDTRHRVWITDSGTASVHIFDPAAGEYREIRRAGDATLQQPSGIVTDAVGRIYFTDSSSGGIYVFNENGEFDRSLFKPGQHPLERPSAIALSQDGRTIYVADPPRNVIVALNREGEVDSTIQMPEDRSEPSSISVFNNQLYVLAARQHRVHILTPGGRWSGDLRWDSIEIPTTFVYDQPRKRFVVANPRSSTVQVFNQAGQMLAAFGQYGDGVDQMRHMDSLYVDARGLVYVVDSHQGKVVVFAESPQP